MEETIVCPNCGEINPADLPYCQYCQWRLRALEGEWDTDRVSDASQQPSRTAGDGEEELAVPEWLRAARDHAAGSDRQFDTPREEDRPRDATGSGDDLLAGLARQDESEEEIPEWVARIMGMPDAGQTGNAPAESEGLDSAEEVEPLRFGAAPDEQRGAGADLTWSAEPPPHGDESDEQDQIHESQGTSGAMGSSGENAEIYEWLKELDAIAGQQGPPQAESASAPSEDVPGWVDRMIGVESGAAHPAAGQADTLPNWLIEQPPNDSRPIGSSLDPAASATPPEHHPPNSLDETDASVLAPTTAGPQKSTPERSETVPAFLPDDMRQLDVDAVFASMHMPDWLTELDRPQPGSSEESPSVLQDDEPIAPADLPSWVEAMRPAESIVTPAADRGQDLRLEENGPLLGLHGVLPAIPGSAVFSGRPRSQSLKLETSERHEAHARLLEDLLASETQPLPIDGTQQFGSQRLLRWVISGLMLIVLGASTLSGSSIFPLPAAVPNESVAAIQAIQSLPPDAAVLAVFDYEPATVGEMEAAAASLMDNLLLLRHPRLAVISTSPTGSALAERFITEVLRDRAYVRGGQYVNLGYLPGGLSGVQAFAQDPSATVPLGSSADRVWDSDVLLGTQELSDFAAIIVLTESLEGGRVWIEQTAVARGSSALVLVSSAQAGPMLLPYFDSGQVDGLVAGLNGAAGTEIANGGLPGFIRRYWDAYSLGLYFAVFSITLGALWQFWTGARKRPVEAS